VRAEDTISVCSDMLDVKPRESRNWINGGEEEEAEKDVSTKSAYRTLPAEEL